MYQVLLVCILPDGEPRARGAPSIHSFLVGPLFPGEPFNEIEQQNFFRLHACCIVSVSGASSLLDLQQTGPPLSQTDTDNFANWTDQK
jgi:hypothetical protein